MSDNNYQILDEDITFVVQGAIYKVGDRNFTRELVGSLKKKHPACTVILSLNSDEVVEFGQDILINCKDVGAIKVPGLKDLNVNRQIFSTLEGLKVVTTKWACKLRTDMVYGSYIDYGKLYGNYQRENEYSVFEERLLVSDITTKNFSICDDYINHVSDWFYFGKSVDLYKLFDIPLYSLKKFPLISGKHQISAETYIWVQHLEEGSLSGYDDACKHLVNNAIIIGAKRLKISSAKRAYRIPFGVNGYAQWNDIDWLSLYNKHFESDARPIGGALMSILSKFVYKVYYKFFFIHALRFHKAFFK